MYRLSSASVAPYAASVDWGVRESREAGAERGGAVAAAAATVVLRSGGGAAPTGLGSSNLTNSKPPSPSVIPDGELWFT